LDVAGVYFHKLLSGAQPNHQSHVGVEFEVIVAQPFAHTRTTFGQTINSLLGSLGDDTKVDLCIVGVRVSHEAGDENNLEQFCCAKNEQ